MKASQFSYDAFLNYGQLLQASVSQRRHHWVGEASVNIHSVEHPATDEEKRVRMTQANLTADEVAGLTRTDTFKSSQEARRGLANALRALADKVESEE